MVESKLFALERDPTKYRYNSVVVIIVVRKIGSSETNKARSEAKKNEPKIKFIGIILSISNDYYRSLRKN